jgi:hypothetical protein
MDAKFHPAIAAIKSGDLERLRNLLAQDPSLATARSSTSHPTLLQCLALDAVNIPNSVAMAQLLIDGGADVNGSLNAAACIDNAEIVALLLDHGAEINGAGSWSPLEEALYWKNQKVIDLLLERGAAVDNLRKASALGRIDRGHAAGVVVQPIVLSLLQFGREFLRTLITFIAELEQKIANLDSIVRPEWGAGINLLAVDERVVAALITATVTVLDKILSILSGYCGVFAAYCMVRDDDLTFFGISANDLKTAGKRDLFARNNPIRGF